MRSVFYLVALTCAVSCNIYSPLTSNASDDDHIEEALICLHKADYACAAAEYAKISNTDVKNEKLCAVNLARAGVTVSSVISKISNGGSNMLGLLATALLPWSEDKKTAADDAKTYCVAYAATLTTNHAKMLKALALFAHCANRISKTDTYVANSNTDTSCTTAGNGDGQITAGDISDNSNGTITAVGMCSADARECVDDIAALDSSSLGDLSGIVAAYNSIPAALKSGTDAIVIRNAIRGFFN